MVITLCGSTRFKEYFDQVNMALTLQGNIVLAPGVFHHMLETPLTTEQKLELDNLHKLKIQMSDAIYVINPQQYIGESTYGEIDWANKLEKKIFFLEPMNTSNQAEADNDDVEEVEHE